MNRKTLGLIFLLFGTLLFVGGLMAGVSSFLGMMNDLDPLAEFKSPAEVKVEITEPGTYTLWHDHFYNNGGKHEKCGPLPHDFTYSLTQQAPGGSALSTFTPVRAGMSQTLSTQKRQSAAVGTFEVQSPGTYLLRGDNKAQEEHRFSLTQGAFMAQLGGFVSKAFLWGILAFLGLVLTVVGIIMMILSKKKSPPALAAQ